MQLDVGFCLGFVFFFKLQHLGFNLGLCGKEKELNTTLTRENRNFPEVLNSDLKKIAMYQVPKI